MYPEYRLSQWHDHLYVGCTFFSLFVLSCTFRTFRTFVLSWTTQAGSKFKKVEEGTIIMTSRILPRPGQVWKVQKYEKYEKYEKVRKSTKRQEEALEHEKFQMWLSKAANEHWDLFHCCLIKPSLSSKGKALGEMVWTKKGAVRTLVVHSLRTDHANAANG